MNRLGNETSLYLRQHADNPVTWQPWDEQALAEARERDCPILLSIGYSACHWCHVMAHESFEDEETAALMNRLYVNIKVDREERPDLDRVYQLAQQMLTGRGGGWPLTVFLDPEGQVPFYAGTYFPLDRRYGMPAFKEVLQAVHGWFTENREDVGQQNAKVLDAIKAAQQPREAGDPHDTGTVTGLVQDCAGQILSRHDAVNGGYGGAPKFPQAPTLEAVAELGEFESGGQLHLSLRFTLEQMARSGLRDHLDGGFFRYCVDGDWTIPHFEKMLYDNAMLLPLYAEGARRHDHAALAEAADGIVRWLESEMKQPDGGYAASIDADADGEEGGFHVWTRDQVEAVLEPDQAVPFLAAYGFDEPPNFEGKAWHLQLRRPAMDETRLDDPSLAEARNRLHNARATRVHPTRDDKRLASWNALLASGFSRAGKALGRTDWLDRADETITFIRESLWTGNGLLAVYNGGRCRFEAYLDDYACLLDALLQQLQARWSRPWLDFAIEVADALLTRFEDAEHGGFFFSDAAVEVPMTRSMIFQDDATPAGNAIALRALNRLGRLLGEPRYTDAADRCALRALPAMRDAPGGHASLAIALQEAFQPPSHLVIAATDDSGGHALKEWAEAKYRVDCYLIGPADSTLPGILREYRSDNPVTAWLCRGMQCHPPVHSREELEGLLKA